MLFGNRGARRQIANAVLGNGIAGSTGSAIRAFAVLELDGLIYAPQPDGYVGGILPGAA